MALPVWATCRPAVRIAGRLLAFAAAAAAAGNVAWETATVAHLVAGAFSTGGAFTAAGAAGAALAGGLGLLVKVLLRQTGYSFSRGA